MQNPDSNSHVSADQQALGEDSVEAASLEPFRSAYRELRYQGPAPEWQPTPTGRGWLRPLLVAAVALVSIGVTLWWALNRTGGSAPAPVSVVVASGESDVGPVLARPFEVPAEVPAEVRLEDGAGSPKEANDNASATAVATEDIAPAEFRRAASGGERDDLGKELHELRQELRQLREKPRALPLAPRSLRLDLPRAPNGRMSTGAPPRLTALSWVPTEGAARD